MIRDFGGATARARLVAACALCVLALTACAKTRPRAGESNTNWLRICVDDAECQDGLACVCGTCTLECDDDAVCGEHGGGTRCEDLPPSCGAEPVASASACLAECRRDADCGDIEDAVCRSGVCARRTRARCPTFEAGVQTPEPVETSFERFDAVVDMSAALVDDDGVYYFDASGRLFTLAHGETEPTLRRPAPPEVTSGPPGTGMFLRVVGMVSDESTLYWSEALEFLSLEPTPPSPPGFLYAMPKTGGEPMLVLETDDEVLTPLAVVDGRILVNSGARLSLVAADGSSREPLPAEVPGENARFMDGKIYWPVRWEGSSDEAGYFNDLFRADPLGGAIEEVTRIEGYDFRAGHGVVLWWQERTHFDPLILDQNFVMLDERTGCTQPLPHLGLTISIQAIMDARHAYWHSFNGLEGISPGDPPTGVPLIRVDLRTGALEQLVTDGYASELTHDVVGQTDERLYLNADGTLVAIDKP